MKNLSHLILGLLLACSLSAQSNSAAQSPDSKKNYVHTLTLADRVRISVYQEDDLTTMARIDARGKINLPLIGEINLGGLTVVQAQEAIQGAYKEGRYLRAPQVTVSVEDYAAREVSIQGQIRNPGRYALPIESTFTVVELVTKAGGITDIGKGTTVSIALNVDDADAIFDRAVKAGATSHMPVTDTFWGARYGQLLDPWGHLWVNQLKEQRTEEEMKAALAADMAKG